jgi:hypothetical protein
MIVLSAITVGIGAGVALAAVPPPEQAVRIKANNINTANSF